MVRVQMGKEAAFTGYGGGLGTVRGTCSHCGSGVLDEHLTRREIDVVLLLAAEMGDDDIAAKLSVSACTVKQHLKNMRRKTDTHSRAGLIVRCYAAGILVSECFPPEWSGTSCLRVRPRGRGLATGRPGIV